MKITRRQLHSIIKESLYPGMNEMLGSEFAQSSPWYQDNWGDLLHAIRDLDNHNTNPEWIMSEEDVEKAWGDAFKNKFPYELEGVLDGVDGALSGRIGKSNNGITIDDLDDIISDPNEKIGALWAGEEPPKSKRKNKGTVDTGDSVDTHKVPMGQGALDAKKRLDIIQGLQGKEGS